VYIYLYVSMHVCMYLPKYICIMYVCMYLPICRNVCIYMYV